MWWLVVGSLVGSVVVGLMIVGGSGFVGSIVVPVVVGCCLVVVGEFGGCWWVGWPSGILTFARIGAMLSKLKGCG